MSGILPPADPELMLHSDGMKLPEYFFSICFLQVLLLLCCCLEANTAQLGYSDASSADSTYHQSFFYASKS